MYYTISRPTLNSLELMQSSSSVTRRYAVLPEE
jgi:hypothetical protein